MTLPSLSKRLKITIIVIGSLIILGAIGLTVKHFFFSPKNTDSAAAYPTDKLVLDIGRHYLLPTSEEPSNIVVKDPAELKTEHFFDGAQAGDRVLLYPKAGLIILYRPSLDRIIKTGNISGGDKTAQASASPAAPAPIPTVYFLNGTNTPGMTKGAEAKVTAASIPYTLTGQGSAKLKSYVKALVVDVTGKNAAAANKIAAALGGAIGTLPSGEDPAPAGTDILVFVSN